MGECVYVCSGTWRTIVGRDAIQTVSMVRSNTAIRALVQSWQYKPCIHSDAEIDRLG